MVEERSRPVVLDRAVHVPRHAVGVLEHQVRFRETLLHVALARLAPVGDVRVPLREEPRHVGVVAQVGMD